MAAEGGQVIECHTVEQWNQHLNKAIESNKLVVVDFTASWCGPCRIIAPVFAEIAKNTPHVVFLKVDVDELKDVAQKYNVEAMPTFLFLIKGEGKEVKEVDRVVGARKEALDAAITKHATTVTATA